jgi:mevalonate kinase
METLNSKVLLFGEYSLLYNSMALTIPYDRFSGKFNFCKEGLVDPTIHSSNLSLTNFCNHILENHMDENFALNVKKFKAELEGGLFFESNIPQGFGLGSSGAIVAAIFLRYLDKAHEFKTEVKSLTKEKIAILKRTLSQLESYFHGSSSGIDPLSILLNQPLLFRNVNDVAPVTIPTYKPEGKNVVFLVNTGLSRSTSGLVGKFKASCEDPSFRERMDNELVQFTNGGLQSFLENKPEEFYVNMDKLVNFQLAEMHYLIPDQFKPAVKSGLDNGDYFLKICGSGGGGFMLGFAQDWETTAKKLDGLDVEVIYKY